MSPDALDSYGDSIRWVVERKDFNAFWPIGYATAATATKSRLIDELERALAHERSIQPVPNPTAILVLFLFSSFAMRGARWPRTRRLALARSLLRIVERSKNNDALNRDGQHLLLHAEGSLKHFSWVSPSSAYLRAVNALAGVSWACSEALYFYNHRIGTERHGPYPSTLLDRTVVVRSVFDLGPRELWPEIDCWPLIPPRIDIGFELAAPSAATKFDMFANPLSEYDITEVTRRVAIRVRGPEGSTHDDIGLDTLLDWTQQLRTLLSDVLEVIDRLSVADRALRVHRIMLYAARTVIGLDVHDDDDAVHDGTAISGSVEDITRFLDLRQEVPE